MVRMAYLAIIGSHKVNGVAELHSDLLKSTLFSFSAINADNLGLAWWSQRLGVIPLVTLVKRSGP
jgi:hypothetical protein